MLQKNFVKYLLEELYGEEIGYDLILPLTNVINERVISRILWELFIEMPHKFLIFYAKLLQYLDLSILSSIMQGFFKLLIDYSILIKVLTPNSLLLLVWVELLKGLGTINSKSYIQNV